MNEIMIYGSFNKPQDEDQMASAMHFVQLLINLGLTVINAGGPHLHQFIAELPPSTKSPIPHIINYPWEKDGNTPDFLIQCVMTHKPKAIIFIGGQKDDMTLLYMCKDADIIPLPDIHVWNNGLAKEAIEQMKAMPGQFIPERNGMSGVVKKYVNTIQPNHGLAPLYTLIKLYYNKQ